MNKVLEQALFYEEENDFRKSEQFYLKALAEYPNDKDVLSYVAIFMFKKGDYENALDLFVQSYSHPDQNADTKENLLEHILAAYYLPYKEVLKKTYVDNTHALAAYEHGHIPSFVDFEDLNYLCIPRNDSEFYIWDKSSQNFKELLVMDKIMTSYQVAINDCTVAVNIFEITKLQSLVEQTRDPAWIDNIKIPVYIVWQDNEKVQQYLQVVNYATIIELRRAVFFSDYNDKSQFEAFFNDHQAILPNKLVGDGQYFKEIIEILNQVAIRREKDISQKIKNIKKTARKYDRDYYKKLFSGSVDKIRILFYTCRFTTVLQYASKDFMQACQALGIQCEEVIEKSDIHRAPSDTELVHKIAEFEPNIIFFIHYFKSDFKAIPLNIMSISWLQDPNYKFQSIEHARQFGWNDFALIITRSWREEMIKTGYDGSRIMYQTIPIDEKIFYARNMSQEEKEFYTADIAFPGNHTNPEKYIAELITKYTTNLTTTEERNRMINFLLITYEALRSRIAGDGELIYRVEQCETLINDLASLVDIKMEVGIVKQLAKDFFERPCYNLYRKDTIKAIIDSGVKVKLWGGGWDTDPDLKDNAMGLLTHGEDLAKMYSCTKIVPASFNLYTAHFRSWETTSCGALCMVRYIPPEFDLMDIREYFKQDEHFIFYNNKRDLIDKIKYYLANEDERKHIAENGRQKVLQNITYTSVVRKCLNFIKKNVTNSN